MKGWRAGSPVACSICASTMPTKAQNRTAKGATLMEDETLWPSGYIIYLWSPGTRSWWTSVSCTRPGRSGSDTRWRSTSPIRWLYSTPLTPASCSVMGSNPIDLSKTFNKGRYCTVQCTVYNVQCTMYSVHQRHRRRMETETKAKCRRFGMGGKIECHTGYFVVWLCSIVYIAVVHFPLLLLGGGGEGYVDLYFIFKQI